MCHDEPLSTTPGVSKNRTAALSCGSNGLALSNVYFEDESKRHLFTRDEANLAKLPELLTQA
jgi:hypothetical protein